MLIFSQAFFCDPSTRLFRGLHNFFKKFFYKFDSVSIRKAVIEENIRSKLILARQTMKNRLIPLDYMAEIQIFQILLYIFEDFFTSFIKKKLGPKLFSCLFVIPQKCYKDPLMEIFFFSKMKTPWCSFFFENSWLFLVTISFC